jgi:hypothetical protein
VAVGSDSLTCTSGDVAPEGLAVGVQKAGGGCAVGAGFVVPSAQCRATGIACPVLSTKRQALGAEDIAPGTERSPPL